MNKVSLTLAVSVALSGCSFLKPLPDPDTPQAVKPSATLSSTDAIAAHWRDIPMPGLVWTPPLISQYADTLQPGVVVYWVPDASLPLASVRWVWEEGTLGLPGKQAIAADLLGSLMRRGGAGALTGAQVDDTLEFLAAQVAIALGGVRSSASVSGLSRDLPFLVDLLTMMVTRPRLDPARLEVLKAEALEQVAHRFDTPAQTQGLAWDRIAYGRGPWTELTDSATLAQIRAADLLEVLKGRFAPRKLWISVAGRFDKDALRAQLLRQVQTLESAAGAASPVAKPIAAPRSQAPMGVYIYDIPATQVQVRLGTRFVRRDHPDYYPLMLASYVLGGGGFGSRLVDRVRSSEGLAYHVSSWAGSEYDREATLGVGLQTKTPSAGRAVYLVLDEIRRMSDSGFREGELPKARQGLSASIPGLFDSPENTADFLLQSASWGRRDDHLRLYQRALDSIPDTTVLQVFRKWFQPESLRIVISGPYDSLVKPFADGSPSLSQWGTVHRLGAKDLESRQALPFEGD
jgi:zinc protease